MHEQIIKFRDGTEVMPVPAVESLDGGTLLAGVEEFITTYVVLPARAGLPVGLWVLGTYLYQAFDQFPYLAMVSPCKRAGKTRLLSVLGLVCLQALRNVFPSPAVLYRVLKRYEGEMTLLLDEVEFLNSKNSEAGQAIIAVLNSGFERGGVVLRCAGPRGDQLEEFPCYCPKALAAIGRLPETISDRSIILPMQRRLPTEHVARFVQSRVKPRTLQLRNNLAALAKGIREDVEQAYRHHGELGFLSDREEDCWLPLFSLLAVIAPERLPELQRAALDLSGQKGEDDVDNSLSLRLLADIQKVWTNEENSLSTDLIQRLKDLEEAPWSTEIELTPRKLARMLRMFGIQSRSVRVGIGLRRVTPGLHSLAPFLVTCPF